MRERVHVNRTMKDLVADLRFIYNISDRQTGIGGMVPHRSAYNS